MLLHQRYVLPQIKTSFPNLSMAIFRYHLPWRQTYIRKSNKNNLVLLSETQRSFNLLVTPRWKFSLYTSWPLKYSHLCPSGFVILRLNPTRFCVKSIQRSLQAIPAQLKLQVTFASVTYKNPGLECVPDPNGFHLTALTM